jgi:hypothetical protein
MHNLAKRRQRPRLLRSAVYLFMNSFHARCLFMTQRHVPEIDRRKASNALLRELVNALKRFTAARDAMWELSLFDRIFRMDKCEQALMAHEDAAADLKKTIQAMARAGNARMPASLQNGQAASEPLITPEELEALLSPNGLLDPVPSGRADEEPAGQPHSPHPQHAGAWRGPLTARSPAAPGRETPIAVYAMADPAGDMGVAAVVADLSLAAPSQKRF